MIFASTHDEGSRMDEAYEREHENVRWRHFACAAATLYRVYVTEECDGTPVKVMGVAAPGT